MRLKIVGGMNTEKSVKWWNQHREDFGEILMVGCDARNGIGQLQVIGTKDQATISGCTCGYGGEGPRGTAKILNDLIETFQIRGDPPGDKIAQTDHFVIAFFKEFPVLLDGKIL